jgi:hypothetical protein
MLHGDLALPARHATRRHLQCSSPLVCIALHEDCMLLCSTFIHQLGLKLATGLHLCHILADGVTVSALLLPQCSFEFFIFL